MLRLLLAVLAVAGISTSALAQAADPEPELTEADRFVIGGVYDEMTTCFAFTTLGGTYAKSRNDEAGMQYYKDQGIIFMQGYEFFGKALGKSSETLASEVTNKLMVMHEKSENLSKMPELEQVHKDRCTMVAENPKALMAEYVAKLGG